MAIESLELLLMNIFGILQIIVLIFATYWSYIIFKFNRLNKMWLFFPLATIIFALRRILILIEFNFIEELIGRYIWFERAFIPLLIASLLAFAVYEMKNQFNTFNIIEKKTKEKTNTITKRKKKK